MDPSTLFQPNPTDEGGAEAVHQSSRHGEHVLIAEAGWSVEGGGHMTGLDQRVDGRSLGALVRAGCRDGHVVDNLLELLDFGLRWLMVKRGEVVWQREKSLL